MNDPIYNRLREISWKRKLTAAEQAELQAWLAAHPEARREWELEAGLNRALERLPETPVSNNFTSRVLQAVEREMAAGARRPASKARWWLVFLPRAAVACLLAGVGVFTYTQHTAAGRQIEMAESVATVAKVPLLPPPEILQDYEAVRLLTPAPEPDQDLLALMTQ